MLLRCRCGICSLYIQLHLATLTASGQKLRNTREIKLFTVIIDMRAVGLPGNGQLTQLVTCERAVAEQCEQFSRLSDIIIN